MRSAARILPVRLTRNRRRLPLLSEASFRIAQISLPGVLFEKASYLPLDNLKALEEFRPRALVGSTSHLLELAAHVRSAQGAFGDLDCAVFVITDFRDAPLSDEDGSRVGDVIPDDSATSPMDALASREVVEEARLVLARLTGREERILRMRFGIGGSGEQTLEVDIQDDPCPCGRPGQRITNPAMDFRDPVRQKLAFTA